VSVTKIKIVGLVGSLRSFCEAVFALKPSVYLYVVGSPFPQMWLTKKFVCERT